MEFATIQLLIFGLLAALGNVLGGLILFPGKLHTRYKSSLRYLLALGAGFMLAVTFFEIIPKTILIWQKKEPTDENLYLPMLLLLAGYLLTQFFEHTIAPHFHLGEEVHADSSLSTSSAYTGVGGLLIHTFFDGVSIAAASQIDVRVGFLVFIAVFLHKFPEGFTIASMLLAAGKGFREVLIATSVIDARRGVDVRIHRSTLRILNRLCLATGKRSDSLCRGERPDPGGQSPRRQASSGFDLCIRGSRAFLCDPSSDT